MRKTIYNVVIILFVLQMSHVQVFANYESQNIAKANSIETLQQQIQKEVMQLSTEFEIRYTGKTSELQNELTELIKHAILDPYIFANISSFQWKYDGYANNIVIQFQFTYHISQEEEAFTEQTLTTIVASMHGLSELEKIQAAHDYIVLTTEYSKDSVGSQYSPYTLLSEGKGVCQAYALVLYRMLDMLGFEVQYVPGKVGEQLHAWVLVKLDNEWYHIDVTWDDPLPDRKGEVRYNYFLVSDKQLAQDHTWDFTSFPSATSEKYADWQGKSRIEVLTKPLANLFTPNSGLAIIENNALQIEHSAQLPNDFQLSDKLNQIVLYEQQDKVVLQSALAVRPVIVKTKINGDARIKRLLHFDKNEKRMPQEKYVIIKEVSLMHYGAPPSSS
ncbi:S-layer protein [Lysinibacillus sphaericus]|uniref:transglutaminase domain-containing protein n=1 Tax=Lysinibacillus sphaericus TaxID=1421 RepID=UPI002161BF98|nr:transglutaminase domain-containing protein [Lysinibacillus sphaericus]MCS1380567.1 S-layer protein [Lysinibacillus sphaericus]